MASNVFTAAFVKFGIGQYGYKSRGENGSGHTGTTPDGKPLVDCSGLVYDALRDAGYQPPVDPNGEYSTATLFDGTDITQAARDSFDVISAADTTQRNGSLQIGDIIMFKAKDGSSQHVGIFSAGELLSLADAGVQSIATGYVEVPHIVEKSATYTLTDGSTGDVANLINSSSYANRYVEGILMVDTNGYGFQEVDAGYLLANGQVAANAYEVLAELDSNHDGLINAQDADYGRLQIWQDTDSNRYYDTFRTLAEAGIQSITASILTDASGNAVNQTGTYTRTDGSTGTTADIWFNVNNTNTIATEWLPETAAVAALPDLQGFGTVYDLHQAMLRDSTGHLQDLVQQFISETDPAARHVLTNQLIYAWVGVENIDPGSRGLTEGQSDSYNSAALSNLASGSSNFLADARQLYVLEAFLGEGYIQGYGYNAGTPNPGWNAGVYLTGIYNELADSLYSQLMAQTHLKPLVDSIGVTLNAATNQFDWDTTGTVAALQSLYNADPAGSAAAFEEFANTLKLSGDSGIQVLDALRAQGDLAGGFTSLLGQIGLAKLTGDAGNNTLTGTASNEVLSGNEGDDTLQGKEGDDYLDGGAGNDFLQGGTGSDVYQFNLGGGLDRVFDMDSTPGNIDTIRFGAGIAAGDITFTRHDYDLVLSINDPLTGQVSDQLSILNWGGGDEYRIERFEFADGTAWDAANDAVFEMRRMG